MRFEPSLNLEHKKNCIICEETLLDSEFTKSYKYQGREINVNRCRLCLAHLEQQKGKREGVTPTELIEPFAAQILVIGLDRYEDQYVFARRRYGEDQLGWTCPTDAGLKRVIELSYTDSLNDQYPFFIVLAGSMKVQRHDERFRHLERVAEEGMRGAMERGKSVQFRDLGHKQHGLGEWYSPCQIQFPQLVRAYQGQAFVDVCSDEFPDKHVLKKTAVELTDPAVADLDRLHRVIIVAAWASRSAAIRNKIGQKAQQLFGV